MSYRTDPEWIAAREKYTADKGADETATAAMLRRKQAARALYEIEARYEREAAS